MTLEALSDIVAAQMTFGAPRGVLVALSGGADSVALALALCRLRDTRGWRVCAAHVNHGLRGAASDGDERFVQEMCSRNALPLRCVRLRPPEGAGETWAREARYAALMQAAQELSCGVIALAHHGDDQAETLLEHLLRGCGPEGLTGMRPWSQRGTMLLARPLLSLSRQELREALQAAGETWREDATNAEPGCLRNCLRLTVLPELEKLAPGAARRMAQAAALQTAEQTMLDEMTDGFLQEQELGWRALSLQTLQALHPVMQGRVLRHWWRSLAPELPQLDQKQTEVWIGVLRGAGRRCNLPGGWHGERGNRYLHAVPPEPERLPAQELGRGQERYEMGCLSLSILPWSAGEGFGDGKRWQAMPAALAAECVLRTRESGDWLRPYGGGGRKSLQDVLTDAKVDAAFRDRVPLVCRGKEVLMAAGITAGNVPPCDEKENLWSLRWEGTLPWLRD